ncbi:MAG TPA: bacteriohopanetetrol glucosamine biosynthesis glycosyltransferase HpnI [Terriglobales bacterium]|nr:bacteriohopanetetrol glucosamine biosynthesis glycosyltransferase HpnI [Terriglobales bacterium]
MLRLALEIIFALFALCSAFFYGNGIWSFFAFTQEPVRDESAPPFLPVSILKPLKGADYETYQSFRSHCLQNYGEYEIIFGVKDAEDSAVPFVEELIAEFPNRDIRLALCPERLALNGKISNLMQMLPQARYAHVLVNDSDIKVPPNYLQQVMSRFSDPKVGMSTCAYRGLPAHTLGSRLEALSISTEFMPGVFVARRMEKDLRFGLGSTLAMSRAALDQVGGFAAVGSYVADDYELGARISQAGYKVALADTIVETVLPPYSFSQFWKHQMRWWRTMRSARPNGYRGLVFTFGFPWAILAVILARGSWWSWTLFAVVAVMRYWVALLIGWKFLQDRTVLQYPWLVPVWDFVGLGIWVWSYAGKTVLWRGERFELERGKIKSNHRDTEAQRNSKVKIQN